MRRRRCRRQQGRSDSARASADRRHDHAWPSPETNRDIDNRQVAEFAINGAVQTRDQAPSISALTPASASGVSTSTSAALPVDRHLDHGFRIAADQVARADVAFDRHQVGEEPPRPQHRIAALAVDRRHHHQRAAAPDRTRRSAGRSARASTCGMSPRQTTAPSASAGTAASPALQRGRQARRRNPDCARAARRARRAPPRPARADGR